MCRRRLFLFRPGYLKDTEKRFAIATLLPETGMVFKAVVGIVFKNEPPSGVQQIVFENQIRNLIEVRQAVGRTGEDIIVLLGTVAYVLKNIRFDNFEGGTYFQLVGDFFHEGNAARKLVNIGNIPAPSGDKFVTVVAGTAEKIEHLELLEIEMIH